MSLGWARSRSFGTFESTYLDWEHRMSIFGKLMSKIFGRGEEAVSTVVVDVEAVLEEMAAKNPQKVLRKLADNGGKIPAELLD